jgi:hypothetical protein
MLWTARVFSMVIGAFAWVASYYLALLGFGANAPTWLLPGIVIFGVVFVAVSGSALYGDFLIDKERRQDRDSDLFDSTLELAHELNQLLGPAYVSEAQLNFLVSEQNSLGTSKANEIALERQKYLVARLAAENRYQQHYRARIYSLFRRFDRAGIHHNDVSLEHIRTGWFDHLQAIIKRLNMVAAALDHPIQ